MEEKVNLGWPNFFNPEKAILRKEQDVQKGKKASQGDKSSILASMDATSEEILMDNRLANIVKDRDRHEWQDVQDLKIKDELRGTLVSLTNLDQDSAAHQGLMKSNLLVSIRAELDNETDVYNTLSETTGDGLRLGTPLFRRRFTPSLGKYGAELTFFDGPTRSSYLYYGNWCGRGGRVAPVDGVDDCCLQHAKCYGRCVRLCPDVWKKPYSTMYAWAILDDALYCVRSESTCVNSVCECDLEAALCLGLQLANSEDDSDLESDDVLFE
ncbi:Phospholipase A2 domain [Trinorchestia longiramus]|nr:Phospholipase A2 domain [Trinorchestia longiramus]